jgi:hypothetical protein
MGRENILDTGDNTIRMRNGKYCVRLSCLIGDSCPEKGCWHIRSKTPYSTIDKQHELELRISQLESKLDKIAVVKILHVEGYFAKMIQNFIWFIAIIFVEKQAILWNIVQVYHISFVLFEEIEF